MATSLAAHLAADLLLEEFEGNEFPADFYNDRARWSLPIQMWFFSGRIPALKRIQEARLNALVADYTDRKDSLFARLLLDERELRLFNRVAMMATSDLVQPNLIVFLDAKTEVLLDRIRRRGRPYEEKIDQAYLDALRGAYERDLLHRGLNVVRYDASSLNLNSRIQMQHLYDAILAGLAPTTVPSGIEGLSNKGLL